MRVYTGKEGGGDFVALLRPSSASVEDFQALSDSLSLISFSLPQATAAGNVGAGALTSSEDDETTVEPSAAMAFKTRVTLTEISVNLIGKHVRGVSSSQKTYARARGHCKDTSLRLKTMQSERTWRNRRLKTKPLWKRDNMSCGHVNRIVASGVKHRGS